MAKKPVYGGYDCHFVDKVSDRFICQICTKILRDPHLAVCCGQHFCKSCLKKWFIRQGKESCPHCRAEGEGFNHVINKGVRSEINQLIVKCSNHGEGCQWTGELGTLKQHLDFDSGCDFVMVECPNKCKEFRGGILLVKIMRRKYLADHLAQSCYLRPYQCEFCGLKDTYKAITGDNYMVMERADEYDYFGHQAECPEARVTCPYECCVEMKRKELENHFSQCPQEPIECPFAEIGCKANICRHQLEDHMSISLHQHMMLLMIDRKQLTAELNDVKTELSEAQDELDETKSKLSSAETEIGEIKAKLHEAEARLTFCETTACTSTNRLKRANDSFSLTMPNFSMYCRSGKAWYSEPFYYREGYKMCLQVCTNRPDGSCINVALHQLKGEYDDLLKWPYKYTSCGHHHSRDHTQESYKFLICGSLRHPQITQIECFNHFCSLGSWSLQRKVSYSDSLTFKVENDNCFINVKI